MRIIENIEVGSAGLKTGVVVLSKENQYGHLISLVRIVYNNTPFNFPTLKEISLMFEDKKYIEGFPNIGVNIDINPYDLEDGEKLLKEWLFLMKCNKQ